MLFEQPVLLQRQACSGGQLLAGLRAADHGGDPVARDHIERRDFTLWPGERVDSSHRLGMDGTSSRRVAFYAPRVAPRRAARPKHPPWVPTRARDPRVTAVRQRVESSRSRHPGRFARVRVSGDEQRTPEQTCVAVRPERWVERPGEARRDQPDQEATAPADPKPADP